MTSELRHVPRGGQGARGSGLCQCYWLAAGNTDLFHWYQRWEDGKSSGSGQIAARREGRVWGGTRFMDAEQREEAGMGKQKDGGGGRCGIAAEI